MFKILLFLQPNLAGRMALDFFCRLGDITDIEIQPFYVEEGGKAETPPGTGWVKEIWEKGTLTLQTQTLLHILMEYRNNCTVLNELKTAIGVKNDLLLTELTRGDYDCLAEGFLHYFDPQFLQKKLTSRFYQQLPYPLLLVKNISSIDKIAFLTRNEDDLATFSKYFSALFNRNKPEVHLLKLEAAEESGTNKTKAEPSPVNSSNTEVMFDKEFSGTSVEIGYELEKYGLILTPRTHLITANADYFQVLNRITTALFIG